MAEDLTKGLNVLLLPKFAELTHRIEKLEAQTKETSRIVALKEDREEVDHFRAHVESQISQVDALIRMVKEKFGQVDELRSQEIRALQRSVEKKVETAALTHLSDQVRRLAAVVNQKADTTAMEQLTMQLNTLSEDVSLKATTERLEDLAGQHQGLREVVALKADWATTDGHQEHLHGLTHECAKKATIEQVEDLCRQLQELKSDNMLKARNDRVDLVCSQVQALGEAVAQRAEIKVTDHLGRQLSQLSGSLALKAENTALEHTTQQLHALGDAVLQKAETSQHDLLTDQIVKLREDFFGNTSNMKKVEDLAKQIEALSSTVALDSAKIKNLCLHAPNLSASGLPAMPPATPSTTGCSPNSWGLSSPASRERDRVNASPLPPIR